jgi:signal transduction histidine kinase
MADAPKALRSKFGVDHETNKEIKILVVDDHDALRYSLTRLLSEAGYQVVEAKTGTEGLTLAQQLPDLITLDINMPDMTGFEVCRKLKSEPATAHIPILHVSASLVDADSKVRGLEGGADGYLTEPIDRAELIATVAALLRLKNAETQARRQAEAAEAARHELAQLNAKLEDIVRARTEELNNANAGLRELSARLLQMRDEEQRRIARELHDGVGQLLAAIRMNNATIARRGAAMLSPELLKTVNENDAMIHETLESIRTMSHLLHPPLLDEAGLRVALQWYCDEFGKRSGIQVELHCPEFAERLPMELETAIFRIVQECLGNVHRHSGSQTADIDLSLAGNRVALSVKDQGTGIPQHRQHDLKAGRIGVGLRGIRERVSQFGGELKIESSDKGTTITALLPFNAHKNSSVMTQASD